MDIINATSIAMPKELNSKLFPTIDEVNSIMIPFKTMLKVPKVKTLIGNDSIYKIGFTNAFKIANTIAATTAVEILAT
jgi:hypothetical protein